MLCVNEVQFPFRLRAFDGGMLYSSSVRVFCAAYHGEASSPGKRTETSGTPFLGQSLSACFLERGLRRKRVWRAAFKKKLPSESRHIPQDSSQTMLAIPSDPFEYDLMKRRNSLCLARTTTSSMSPRPAARWISSRWRPPPTLLYLHHLKTQRTHFDKLS